MLNSEEKPEWSVARDDDSSTGVDNIIIINNKEIASSCFARARSPRNDNG